MAVINRPASNLNVPPANLANLPVLKPPTSDRDALAITILYFLFKIVPCVIAGFCIYLGYKLFVLGVTGQASISVNTKTVSGQLLNAAPGLFFAVGGIVVLIAIVWKSASITSDYTGGINSRPRRSKRFKN